MTNSIEFYYSILFLLSIIFTCVYVYMYHKHFNVNLTLVFTMIPIVNLGYVFLSRSSTIKEAILSLKIIYLGGCFLILFSTFFIFSICQISVPQWFKTILLLISMALYMSVMTIGDNPIFYKGITGVAEDGRLVVHRLYGPMHTVFYIVLSAYFAMGFAAIIYSLVKKAQVSRRIICLLYVPETVCFICYFGQKILTNKVEIIPAAYVVSQLFYLIIAHFICVYDIADSAVDSLIETGSTGFISFDFNMKYLGSNITARHIFEDLINLTVDKPLSDSEDLCDIFMPWIDQFIRNESNDKFYYKSGRYVYLVDINYLYHNGRKTGYQFVITDDTKNQKYIELLDNYNHDLEKEVRIKTTDITRMHNNLIKSMAKMIESRDNSTGGHIVRTSDVVEILMDEIMKDESFATRNGITESFRRNIISVC